MLGGPAVIVILSITGYLESLPLAALMESRVAQFLEVGGSKQRTPASQTPLQPSTLTDQSADILKQVLELAIGRGADPPSVQPKALTSISAGLPALPTKLLNRIWANEYIDFAELPLAKGRQRSLPNYLESQILLVHMHELDNTKKIPDFETWAQCFALYSAALPQKQPERAVDLMAYFYSTANNARKYRWPLWLVYDQNFRQLMADTQDSA